MQVREDNSHMYPITQLCVASPVTARTVEEGSKIELAMKANIEEIKNRTHVDITGIPPEKDLYTAIPNRSYLKVETHPVNERRWHNYISKEGLRPGTSPSPPQFRRWSRQRGDDGVA